MRASSQASGTPNRIAIAVAHSEHTIESRSAVRDVSEVRIDQTSPHGAFHSSPMNGSAKNATPIAASTSTGHGRRSRPTRRERPRAGALAAGGRDGHRVVTAPPKPYFAMIAWPSGPVRKSMNA